MTAKIERRKSKRLYWLTTIVLLAGLTYGIFYINALIPIVTGYPARYLCSAVFNSNRVQEDVEALDLNFSLIRFTKNEVNFQDSSVTSSFLWGKSKAVYRKGFGSTLLRETDEATLRSIQFPQLEVPANNPDTIDWPMGNLLPPSMGGIDTLKLAAITQKLMIDKAYNGNAFAFIVVHKGNPVAESYSPPFHLHTRFQSWSMAKSFTNALVGNMVMEGKLDISKPVGLPEWQNDGRRQITINHLMQMESGLQWNEDYGTRSDVTVMLYCEHDFARYAYQRPLEFPVGNKWLYSSGSVNIINYLMRQAINDDDKYYTYAHSSLLHKIGIRNAVFEVDASQTQVGSSYIYATARDYARLGLLYLQDGMFNGERVLPEGWVNYTTTAAAQSEGAYGSLFWLNRNNYYPSLPQDMYSANGHEGQRLFIIPSKDLVVVVLGYSPKPDRLMNFETLLGDIIQAIN
jgi:CubicO group peptidase (beta-lactamase class C family)